MNAVASADSIDTTIVRATAVSDSVALLRSNVAIDYSLAQNFPDPFADETAIEYTVPIVTHVSLQIFDMTGKFVAALAEGEFNAGTYRAVFRAGNIPSGVYYYRMESGGFIAQRRMLLVK